jgi:methylated-DNA-[protein]-cysteine S-methyltransferase
MIHYDVITRTIVGDILIAATSQGLCAVLFGKSAGGALEKRLAATFPGEPVVRDRPRLGRFRKEIEEYFAGKRSRFTMPIDLHAVRSPFQRKVLRKLHALPFGRVTTYGDLAARSGAPGAARAVGTAMSKNPVALVVPCHRVVGAAGSLGGFSGGLSKKKTLLLHEGVAPTKSGLLKAGGK